jgi:ATP-dependent helicase/nuclease subunit A
VDVEAIARLFASPLGKRMRGAKELHREFKFSLLADAGEIFGRGEGEDVLLQGVVDCYLVEDGEITVIDYKTDFLRSRADVPGRAEHYAGQLRAYARALERICGLPVRACVLYFLSIGEAFVLPPEKP